jgi:hypothetical protein
MPILLTQNPIILYALSTTSSIQNLYVFHSTFILLIMCTNYSLPFVINHILTSSYSSVLLRPTSLCYSLIIRIFNYVTFVPSRVYKNTFRINIKSLAVTLRFIACIPPLIGAQNRARFRQLASAHAYATVFISSCVWARAHEDL